MLFLLLGFSLCAQEVELVKSVPFLEEGEAVIYFRSDFLRVGVKGKAIRLFKPNGELLTPVVYDDFKTRGYPILRLIKNGKYGFVSLKGSGKVSPLVYDEIKPFKCGCSIAKKDSTYYVIDTLGNELLLDFDIDFKKAKIVASNGLISYKKREEVKKKNGMVKSLTAYRYITFNFQEKSVEKIEGVISEYPDFQDDHLCKYGGFINSASLAKRKKGLVNAKGEVVVTAKEKFKFRRVNDLIYFTNEDGTFMLDDDENTTQLSENRILFSGWGRDSVPNSFIWIDDSKVDYPMFGIMNNRFQKVTSAKYSIYENIGGSLFKFYDRNTKEFGVLDEDGEVILKDDYLGVTIFYDKNIFAQVDSTQWRWFDNRGSQVIPFDFFSRFNAIDKRNNPDYSVVAVKLKGDGGFVVYDNLKKEFWKGEYDDLRFINEGELIIATRGERVGLLDFKGNFVIDLVFDLIYEREVINPTKNGAHLMKGLIVKNEDEKWFYSFKGERKFQVEAIPEIYKVSNDYFWVKSKNEWQIYKIKK